MERADRTIAQIKKQEKHINWLAKIAPAVHFASLRLRQEKLTPSSGSPEEIILWLISLSGKGQWCAQGEILKLIRLWYPMDKTVFSRKVSSLMKKSLIVSIRDSEDNRKNWLCITESGQNRLDYFTSRLAIATSEVLEGVKKASHKK